MESIKVKLNNKPNSYETLNIESILYLDGRLRISLLDAGARNLHSGNSIIVTRYFTNSEIKQINNILTVYDVLDDKNIIVSNPDRENVPHVIKNEYINEDEVEWPKTIDVVFDSSLFLYKNDIATVKRVSTAENILLTFAKADGNKTVTIINPTILDDVDNTKVRVTLSKDDFKFINDNSCYADISSNIFYFRERGNLECKRFSDYSDETNVVFSIYASSYNISLGLAQNVDHVGLYKEELSEEIFENEYLSNLIPNVIDYEKVRFTPKVLEGGIIKNCKKLVFKLHFRSRYKTNDWAINTLAEYGWNNNFNESDITPRNRLFFSGDTFDKLGFTEDEVRYQKMSLKKSFIRILFYDSKDKLEQKLLAYSTVFLDTTEIRDKYVKLKNSGITEDIISLIPDDITITDNYNSKKSSEGFYLYLFKSDAPLENEEKTIYMKVEFNHAKYGRTIAMLNWPYKNGAGELVTPKNFFDALYMPVKLTYNSNMGYVCMFPKAYNNYESVESEDITFVFFEPRLSPQLER